jgi:phosphoribosylamine---glycine ligase
MGVTRVKRVMIVGGGGREHALAWVCGRDPQVEVVCAPGNAGTAAIARNVAVDVSDARAVAEVAERERADLVVIGPDAAAAAGVADACAARDIAVFGPTAAAARIESSKAFAKQLMVEASIPTARFVAGGVEDRAMLRRFVADLGGACVVKADGLALGKGVVVCDTALEADAAIAACLDEGRFGAAGATVVVEERLAGAELSVFALSDGTRLRLLAPARDHKRLNDGDRGPNTGGMGAVAPPPEIDALLLEEVRHAVLQPCVDALRERGAPFVGCLYAGLMLTASGPRVLEFNARFGDPEAQVILPLLAEPATALFEACARGEVDEGMAPLTGSVAVGVVAAAAGYPGTPRTGDVIEGVDAMDADVLLFHAGTARARDGSLRTAGGRVLCVVARGGDSGTARARAYENLTRVRFEGMQFRRDIGVTAGAMSATAS